MKHSEPPGYRLQEPRPKPKIGPYLERIAQIIEEDKVLAKKQRHTAKRIYERIREMGYTGRYTQVKEAVREITRVKQEVFMPLVHRPGEAQVDFGYALAKVSQIQTPEALARFALLIGLTLLILTAIGHAVASRHPEVRLASKKKGPRLSLITVGCLFLYSFFHTQGLSQAFLEINLPPPTLRSFSWLEKIKRGTIPK